MHDATTSSLRIFSPGTVSDVSVAGPPEIHEGHPDENHSADQVVIKSNSQHTGTSYSDGNCQIDDYEESESSLTGVHIARDLCHNEIADQKLVVQVILAKTPALQFDDYS